MPAPTDQDIAHVARAAYRKVQRLTARGKDENDQMSLLDDLANASVQGLVATGPRRGCRVLRLGCGGDAVQAAISGKRCAEVAGFNVHANTSARAHDRKRLEILVKYLARPPIAHGRLTTLTDGRLALQFKQPWRDGTTHIVFTAQELIERLIPLIPRPRANVIRYHGILGPAAKDRHKIVPRSGPVEYGRETSAPRLREIDPSTIPRSSAHACKIKTAPDEFIVNSVPVVDAPDPPALKLVGFSLRRSEHAPPGNGDCKDVGSLTIKLAPADGSPWPISVGVFVTLVRGTFPTAFRIPTQALQTSDGSLLFAGGDDPL